MHAGINLREALDEARRLGCSVEAVPRSGEIVVRHPAWARQLRLNGRKKSAPRQLITLVGKLLRAPRQGA